MRNRPETPEQRFDRLYTDTCDDLFAYLVRRSRTREDAADALAETFAAAWRKLDSLPEGDRARLWLFGAARNELRKAAGRQRTDDDLGAALSSEAARALCDGWPETEADEAALEAIATLSRLDQEIITLTAWEELAPREIAVVLGLSANVVRIRLHRARGDLRSLLKREQRLEVTPSSTRASV